MNKLKDLFARVMSKAGMEPEVFVPLVERLNYNVGEQAQRILILISAR